MPFRENFQGVNEQDGEFVEIPAAVYPVGIDRATEAQTKTGLNMIKVKFRILEGEYQNSPLFTNVVFHEKMKGRNMHILKVLGLPYGGELIIDAEAWRGRECRVRVRVSYNQQFKRFVSEITQWMYLTEEEEQKAKVEKKENQFREEVKGQADRIFGPKKPPAPSEVPEKTEEEEELPF